MLLHQTMTEWQPARFRFAHDGVPMKQSENIGQTVFRVRQITDVAGELVSGFRRIGCDGHRWFMVHPDDVSRFFAGTVYANWTLVMCEHEVLTD